MLNHSFLKNLICRKMSAVDNEMIPLKTILSLFTYSVCDEKVKIAAVILLRIHIF